LNRSTVVPGFSEPGLARQSAKGSIGDRRRNFLQDIIALPFRTLQICNTADIVTSGFPSYNFLLTTFEILSENTTEDFEMTLLSIKALPGIAVV
jgi:hypothetical protein